MPDETLQIEVVGLDKLLEAFEKYPNQVIKNMARAGREASANVILREQGIGKNYPPAPPSSTPPAPYYKRGTGYMYAGGGTKANSERMGTSWVIKSQRLETRMGPTASYAKWIHGDKTQRAVMKRIGWRTLLSVAREKLGAIQKVYQGWVDKTLKEVGLK